MQYLYFILKEMADPTIQTFCCHLPNNTDRAVDVMFVEFNSDSYNTVCLLSSCIGILGALYQVLPREDSNLPHRWYSFSATRGRQIVIWLALADLLASLGVFIRSALWLNAKSVMQTANDTASIVFCAASSAWIQYFYTATWLWTLCYAIDVRLVLKEREGHPVFYHFAAWTIPAVLTSIGLSILYVPDANCHSLGSLSSALIRILPNYCATYLPMAVVMLANPSLYVSSTRDVEKVIARSLSQFTRKERDIVDAIKLKFSLINIAFYICWLPNIINGILLWVLWFNLPEKVIVTVWYIMAVTNPLQALFNSLVYRRWSSSSERVYIPCRQEYTSSNSFSSDSSWPEKENIPGEETPLLESETPKARISINGASSEC